MWTNCVILAAHVDSTDFNVWLIRIMACIFKIIRITARDVMQVNGQPAAVNMREMVWDEELARLAQRFSRNFYDICFQPKCILGYNDFNNLVMQSL
jgi:hypothetical protein